MQENEISVPDNPQQTETHSLQAMSFSEILDGIFSLYRKHFALFFRIIAIYFILTYVYDKIMMYFLYDKLFMYSQYGSPSGESMTPLITMSLGLYLIILLVNGVISYASAEVLLGRTITPSAAYKHTLSKYISLLACAIIYLVACTGLALTCIGIPFSVFLFVRWSVSGLPILIEDNSAMRALRRSGELVKNMWWRVFGISLAIILIYYMIATILSNSIGIVFFLFTGIGETQDAGILETIKLMFFPSPVDIGWIPYLIRSLVTTAIQAITMPIGTIGITLLYFDLRVRKEAYDLEMQAAQQQVSEGQMG